jgi:hypothetical protein
VRSPGGTALTEDIPLIELHATVAEQSKEFLLEVTFPVVHLLIADISPHGRNLRRADAEGAVTLLPGKIRSHPSGRSSLKFLDCLGEGVVSREKKEEMKMIGRSPGLDETKAFIFSDAAEIVAERLTALWCEQRRTVFRAEDAVDEIVSVGMSHGSAVPPGLLVRPPRTTPRRQQGSRRGPRGSVGLRASCASTESRWWRVAFMFVDARDRWRGKKAGGSHEGHLQPAVTGIAPSLRDSVGMVGSTQR